jgi:hypothetical protein
LFRSVTDVKKRHAGMPARVHLPTVGAVGRLSIFIWFDFKVSLLVGAGGDIAFNGRVIAPFPTGSAVSPLAIVGSQACMSSRLRTLGRISGGLTADMHKHTHQVIPTLHG